MKTTLTLSSFVQAFCATGRTEHFSYDGLEALFNYLEELEKDTGEEIELDVIAICCEYTESTVEEIASDYSIDLSEAEGDEDEIASIVEGYLNENTMIVAKLDNGNFVYAQF